MLRTHTCCELTKKDIGKVVTLCGWAQSRRDHGGIIFIDLRDRYGINQVVFDPEHNASVHKSAEKIGREWVLRVTGKVVSRPKGMENPKMHTGEIEIMTDKLEILNKSEVPPIDIEDRLEANEEMRLKYRYLDLRRPVMQNHLLTRHTAAQSAREFLSKEGFLEIETPMFVKTTPGGARVFKVPSRVHPGKFYALPESPQIYKQLLMVAGCDKYFQLTRCMRDEDLRADRQPEFTQIDIEQSFVEEEDIFSLVEGLLKNIFKKAINAEVKTPFKRLTWHDAMAKYGSDKPDLRFGLELSEVTKIAEKSDFSVFKNVIAKGGVVYALNASGCASFTRTDIEALIELAKLHHLPGLAWAKVADKGLESSITKYISEPVQKELIKATGAKKGDLLLFAADKFIKAVAGLGQVRLAIAQKKNLVKNALAFCWVVDFPSYEFNEDSGKWQATHHIFTAPKEEDVKFLEKEPGKVRSKAYDIVLNGVELGGGSIRIHDREVQKQMLKVTGLTFEEAEKKFDFLLEAFKYGAPPHGGIAMGFDRLCALLLGITDIREAIAFPKTKNAENPLDNSPQDWTPEWLKELHLKLDTKK